MNEDQPKLSPVVMLTNTTDMHTELAAQVGGQASLCATLATDLLESPDVAEKWTALSMAIGNHLHQRLFPGESIDAVIDLTQTHDKKAH